MFPEGMDLGALMQQAQAMQEKMQAAQQELQESSFTGTAGGDLVTATMTGAGELVGLAIKPEAVDVDDLESLSDLIVAAVRDASTQASNKAQEILPDIDGLGF